MITISARSKLKTLYSKASEEGTRRTDTDGKAWIHCIYCKAEVLEINFRKHLRLVHVVSKSDRDKKLKNKAKLKTLYSKASEEGTRRTDTDGKAWIHCIYCKAEVLEINFKKHLRLVHVVSKSGSVEKLKNRATPTKSLRKVAQPKQNPSKPIQSRRKSSCPFDRGLTVSGGAWGMGKR